jgi:hypothetical protein
MDPFGRGEPSQREWPAASSLPRTRKKIEKERAGREGSPASETAMQTTSCDGEKLPPDSRGAFFNPFKSARLSLAIALALVLASALCLTQAVEAGRTSATPEPASSARNELDRFHPTTHSKPASSKQRDRSGPASRLSDAPGHLASSRQRQSQRQRQQRLQRSKLKYLIERTSSMPRLIARGFEQPSQLYKQFRRQSRHLDNEIAADDEQSLPNSVPRSRSQQPASVVSSRRRPTAEERRNGIYSAKPVSSGLRLDELDAHFDMGLADFDDVEDFSDDLRDDDDGDDDDDDLDADADEAAEDEDEEEEEGEASEPDDEDYASHFDGDSRQDEPNAIPLDDPRASNKLGAAKWSPFGRSPAATRDRARPSAATDSHASGEPKLSKYSQLWNESAPSLRSGDFRRHWGRHFGQAHPARPSSHIGMVTSETAVHSGDPAARRQQQRQQHRSRKQEPPPAEPYQSPVVVSISDNSFVSASPISGMETSSVSDADGVESPRRPEAAAVHYSHIIAGPTNEWPSYGRKPWHDSHVASIRMVQEVSALDTCGSRARRPRPTLF